MAVRILFLCVTAALAIAVIGGGAILQVYLSRQKNKWLGLILPGCTVLIALVAAMAMGIVAIMMFSPGEARARAEMTDLATGETTVIFDNIIELNGMAQPTIAAILPPIMTFLVFNVPTAVLLAIYFACRAGLVKNREIEKMGIQDL